jgi:hypothetical protein
MKTKFTEGIFISTLEYVISRFYYTFNAFLKCITSLHFPMAYSTVLIYLMQCGDEWTLLLLLLSFEVKCLISELVRVSDNRARNLF